MGAVHSNVDLITEPPGRPRPILMHRALLRFLLHIQRQCIRLTVLHPERLDTADGVLIAPTHVGHLESFFVSLLRGTPIHWMTRIEFYRYWPIAWARRRLNTFPVHRQGIPVSSIRRAIALIDEGNTVGVYPEGGVARGEQSMMYGGPPKGGVCVISMRTGAPIIPIALVGMEALSAVKPWIPFRRGELWVAIGNPIEAPTGFTRSTRRAVRFAMMDRLGAAYVGLREEIDAVRALS